MKVLMFDKLLRPVKDKILIPVTHITGRFLSPNQISILAFISGIICGLFIVRGWYKTALVFWLLNRIFDGLDGTVARNTHSQSDFGAYLDIMLDFVIYAFIPVSLYYYPLADKNPAALFLLLIVFYINTASWMYLSALLEKRKQGTVKNGEITSVTMHEGLCLYEF